jgi:hypothetical protein
LVGKLVVRKAVLKVVLRVLKWVVWLDLRKAGYLDLQSAVLLVVPLDEWSVGSKVV